MSNLIEAILSLINLFNSNNVDVLIKSGLIIFFTILLIYILKFLTNIKVDLISIGTDLNLFTFGFLFDIALKAMEGKEYWSNYSYLLSKNYLLLIIFTANALIMMVNFKLENHITTVIGSSNYSMNLVDYLYRPCVIFLGIVSLSIYLILNLTFS